MFKLKSLGNQMNHFYRMGSNLSGKELLMWNDIQEQFQWESNKFHGNLIAFWSIRIRKGIIDSLFKFNSLADQIRRTNSRTVPLGIK